MVYYRNYGTNSVIVRVVKFQNIFLIKITILTMIVFELNVLKHRFKSNTAEPQPLLYIIYIKYFLYDYEITTVNNSKK